MANPSPNQQYPIQVLRGPNLGKTTFTANIPLHEFFDLSNVAHKNNRISKGTAQRELNIPHAKKLALYILKGLVASTIHEKEKNNKPCASTLYEIQKHIGDQPYYSLQPFVVNIRNACKDGSDLVEDKFSITTQNQNIKCEVIKLSKEHLLWVIDGQHRRAAAHIVIEYLKNILETGHYPNKRGNFSPYIKDNKDLKLSEDEVLAWADVYEVSLKLATISVEIHLGLTIEEERQLFHDLNNLGKKVDQNQAISYDNSNPINGFIKKRLQEKIIKINDTNKENKDWLKHDGHLKLKDVAAINAMLFLGKASSNSATTEVIQRTDIGLKFWKTIIKVQHFGVIGGKAKSIIMQPVVLKALAKLAWQFKFSKTRPDNGDQLFEQLLYGIENQIDFSHQNKIWRYYTLDKNERDRDFYVLGKDYLPLENTGNRDLGNYSGGLMRFGNKSNDIYPILADMIRYILRLPSVRK